MNFIYPNKLSIIFFLIIILYVLFSIYYSLRLSKLNSNKIISIVIAWILLSSLPVLSGAALNKPFPILMIYFVASNLMAIFFGLSNIGKSIAQSVPIRFIILFQCFRLPLELILHSWVEQGTIPNTMTWTGLNFDIITGILAILFYFICRKYQKSAIIFNVIGFLLLINVARVAIFSSPLPFAWSDIHPPLQLGMYFPFSLIVTVCVAGALLGHILLFRALKFQRQKAL